MSLHGNNTQTIGQWASDNWLAGVSASEMACEMSRVGWNGRAILSMRDFIAEMDLGMASYSEMQYGLQLIEMHATRGGRGF